jgi:hypothetical protein
MSGPSADLPFGLWYGVVACFVPVCVLALTISSKIQAFSERMTAGQEHGFVDFSGDFATWVFFYGRSGFGTGELPPEIAALALAICSRQLGIGELFPFTFR